MDHLHHIAIIPDGNRRWTKANQGDLESVYYIGCLKILDFSSHIFMSYPDVQEVSIFFVSLENLRFRATKDLNPLFKSGLKFIEGFYLFAKNKSIELNWIGLKDYPFTIDSEYFYQLKDKINSFPKISSSKRKLNILIGYDVEEDINRVVSTNDGKFNLSELQVKSQVGLVIRSGGEHRLSGFLPLNTLYSELHVYDQCFPDMQVDDIDNAIHKFTHQTKNFGT